MSRVVFAIGVLMAITSSTSTEALTTSSMLMLVSHHSFTRHNDMISSSNRQSSSSPHYNSCLLLAYRDRSGGGGGGVDSSRYNDDQSKHRSRNNNNNSNSNKRSRDYKKFNADSSQDYDNFDDDFTNEYNPQRQQQQQQRQQRRPRSPIKPSSSSSSQLSTATSTTTDAGPSTFYSQKSLSDPTFSISNNSNNQQQEQPFFQQLCSAAQITRPSRIQSMAWPHLLNNENCIVADQTGSGKTLSYLLPLLQRLHSLDTKQVVGEEGVEGGGKGKGSRESSTQYKKKRTGTPRVVVLTPTAELADQIYNVCSSLSKNLSSSSASSGGGGKSWSFNPFVTTATGSQSTNIRDQIRLLQSTPIDILISTPGRLSTILRTKNAGLDLGHVTSLVLDEVDFLLVDETFGPQLRTVGVAVSSSSGIGENDGNEQGGGGGTGGGPQFIFVTATLPEDVLESIQSEFSNIKQLRGPGLHRITPAVQQTLIDVSVPATSNQDKRACFDIKVREMFTALRAQRCSKTLIFCNTVETCRNVENVLRRKDRKGRRNRVWAYHNALSPEVRLKNLQSFSSSSNNNDDHQYNNGDDNTESILVCTDRAARGIDFDGEPVDHILLFDFPKDPAEYVRRVGRTARAGRSGASTVLGKLSIQGINLRSVEGGSIESCRSRMAFSYGIRYFFY